jgi:hypothetical protein
MLNIFFTTPFSADMPPLLPDFAAIFTLAFAISPMPPAPFRLPPPFSLSPFACRHAAFRRAPLSADFEAFDTLFAADISRFHAPRHVPLDAIFEPIRWPLLRCCSR